MNKGGLNIKRNTKIQLLKIKPLENTKTFWGAVSYSRIFAFSMGPWNLNHGKSAG
jgi:hypothetical protein